MSKSKQFTDGLTSLVSSLTNKRKPTSANIITHERVSNQELNSVYKSGLGNKIVRLKSGYALTDTIEFKTKEQELFYNLRLKKAVKRASRFQLAFGRAIVVIMEQKGTDLSQPLLASADLSKAQLKVFPGAMVSAFDAELDLAEPRYNKPNVYSVRDKQIHYSRVIDFTYVDPIDTDAPQYQYGGISEFELIYDQLVNDGIVERSSAYILEKNATLFYRLKNFKQALANKKEKDIVKYFSQLEQARSIYGAAIMDAEDVVESHTQALSNLSESNVISLQRVAMVTGIPFSELVGESPKGLNATGDNEQKVMNKTIKTFQEDFLLEPINHLMVRFGQPPVKFKSNQEPSAGEKIDFETKVIDNAVKLFGLGEDHVDYLSGHGIKLAEDELEKIFSPEGI